MADVLTHCKLLVDGYDLSGYHNALGIDYGAESKDATVFGGDTRIHKGGLKAAGFSHQGLWDAVPDERWFERVGIQDTVMSVAPGTGADGEIAYAMRVLSAEYSPGGRVGDLLAFAVSGKVSGDTLVRGTILHNAAQSGNGSGTARQLGAVSATQRLYAALHVLAAGTTLTVKVQSDDGVGFASATDRITFAAATAVGAQWATPVAGAITDDWWRVSWTLTGSFTFVVVVAIQ